MTDIADVAAYWRKVLAEKYSLHAPPASLVHRGTGVAGCPVCGGMGGYVFDVPTNHPEFGKIHPCECVRDTEEARRRRYLRARLPVDALSFAGLLSVPGQVTAITQCWEFVNASGKAPYTPLVLTGVYGAGKSQLAKAVALECLERGQEVLYTTVEEWLESIRQTFGKDAALSKRDVESQVERVDVLVLDEWEQVRHTDWTQAQVFALINARCEAGRGLVLPISSDALPDLQRRFPAEWSRIRRGILGVLENGDLREAAGMAARPED